MKPVAKSRGGGPSSRCKPCSNKATREWSERPESKEIIKERSRQWRKNNPDKCKASKKAFRERNPEKVKAGVRKCHKEHGPRYSANKFPGSIQKKYGLSEDQYLAIWDEQLDRCAICQTEELDGIRGKLCVDHCHTTGKVRGLLCFSCNTMLGNARDRIETLQRAIEYLQDPHPLYRTFKTSSYLSEYDDDLQQKIWKRQAEWEYYEEPLTEEQQIEEVFA